MPSMYQVMARLFFQAAIFFPSPSLPFSLTLPLFLWLSHLHPHTPKYDPPLGLDWTLKLINFLLNYTLKCFKIPVNIRQKIHQKNPEISCADLMNESTPFGLKLTVFWVVAGLQNGECYFSRAT